MLDGTFGSRWDEGDVVLHHPSFDVSPDYLLYAIISIKKAFVSIIRVVIVKIKLSWD